MNCNNVAGYSKQARKTYIKTFNDNDYVFSRTNPRAVQKRARQGSRSGIRQEFSKPKDYQMPRAVNEVSRSFSNQDIVFTRTNARAVQKRARQGSHSDVRQEFSKPKDYRMPCAANEVSRRFSNYECVLLRT